MTIIFNKTNLHRQTIRIIHTTEISVEVATQKARDMFIRLANKQPIQPFPAEKDQEFILYLN